MKRNITKLLHSAIPLLVIVLLMAMSNGCSKAKDDYYSRPTDMSGPLWEQLTANTNFTKFTQGIEKVSELKRIINTSGLYTVFAPTNAAWDTYFANSTKYKSFDDFKGYTGTNDLKQLINYHIIYNMWYSSDFISSVNLEDLETDDTHRYKTRAKDLYDTVLYVISKSPYVALKRVVRKPEKILNIYTENYIVKQEIVSDYKQLYGVDATYFNVDGAQVILQLKSDGTQIFKKEDLVKTSNGKIKNDAEVKQMYDIEAANGSIHAINRVLTPVSNIEVTIDKLCGKSVLSSKPDSVKYVDLLNRFIKLTFDQTNSTAENKNTSGGLDSLFNKTYVDEDEVSLGFDFSSESSNVTLFLPTNEALQKYFKSVGLISGYDMITEDGMLSSDEFDSIPDYTLRLMLNQSVVTKMVWPTKLEKNIVSMNGDTIKNPSVQSIVPASNGMVYLVNEVVKPTAFSTVAQVPLLNSKFKLLSKALEYTGLYDYLTYAFHQLTFFAPTDDALKAGGITYGYVGEKNEKKVGQFYFNKAKVRKETLDSLLRFCILRKKVSYSELDANADATAFYQTRQGSYLVVSRQLVETGKIGGVLVGSDVNSSALISSNADERNIECINGYVHIVVQMPAAPLKTVASILKDNSAVTKFVKILKAQKISAGSTTTIFDLLGDPESADRFTVLAPNDTLVGQLEDSMVVSRFRMNTDTVYGNVIWRKIALAHIIKQTLFSDGRNFGTDIDGNLLYDAMGSAVNNTLATFKDGRHYQVRLIKPNASEIFGFEAANNNISNAREEYEQYYDPTTSGTGNISYKCYFVPTYVNLQGINGVVHVADKPLTQVASTRNRWYNFEKVFAQ